MIGPEARGAWKELEQRLRPYLARRVASRADVDDVVQDILVRVYEGLGALRDEERFGAWVYRVANSAIIDRARRHARSSSSISSAESTVPAPSAADDEQLQSELGECVALFVGRLPSPYREAVTLTELQGLSQKQAAEMLEISLSGLKSRVQRGREKIRYMFEECCRISLDCRGRVIECEPREGREGVPSPERATARTAREAPRALARSAKGDRRGGDPEANGTCGRSRGSADH
ncbi:MAG: sigma-70 family RNA polymerase sigma factor [Myxococcales bacterium]|nr:MAG: sigma-70 family RNA polymerase sigma factor [Myxococcales bacterium]